jgi:hypothetical protein
VYLLQKTVKIKEKRIGRKKDFFATELDFLIKWLPKRSSFVTLQSQEKSTKKLRIAGVLKNQQNFR